MALLNRSLRTGVRSGFLCGLGLLVFLLIFAGLDMPQNTGMSNRLNAQNNNNNNNNNSGGNNRGGNNNNNNNNNNNDSEGMDDARYMQFGYRSVVGGFSIDTRSAFRQASKEELSNLAATVKSSLQAIPADLNQPSAERKISLRRLGDLLADCAKTGSRIPDSARYLGGLTSVQYVVAVPEDKDIYLVGPAEGWTADAAGTIVGKTSGKPVLLLEDFLTVLRAWNTQNPELISCSIDPSREALQNFAGMQRILDPVMKKQANEQAMGLMDVSFSGIPSESRMARVLATADFRMKRISLGFDPSPVKGLNSYAGMIRRGSAAFAPRFWIEPSYSTIYHDPDKMVWNLSDTKVNTLTEREYFDAHGQRRVSAKKDLVAQKWAGNMTKYYNELSKAEPVFAEARNCMDIALVVALVYFQNLPEKAGLSFSVLTDSKSLDTPRYPAPAHVGSESLVRVLNRQGDFVSVTGGVLINPWEVVKNDIAPKAELAKLRTVAAFENGSWWTN